MKKSFFAVIVSFILFSNVSLFAANDDSIAQKAGNIVHNIKVQAEDAARAIENRVKEGVQVASDTIHDGLDSLDAATKPAPEREIRSFFKRMTDPANVRDVLTLIGGIVVALAVASFIYRSL